MCNRKINLPISLLVASLLTGCAAYQYSPMPNAGYEHAVAVHADLATFNEAVALVESRHYEEAMEKFRQAFDNFEQAGNRKRAAETLFWLGFCREKQQRPAEASAIYLRLVEEYAGTRAAQQAERRLSLLSGKLDL